MIIVFVELVKGNCHNGRNVATEGNGNISQSSKKNKSICLWIFWKKSQIFFKIYREESVLGSFYCKVASCNVL